MGKALFDIALIVIVGIGGGLALGLYAKSRMRGVKSGAGVALAAALFMAFGHITPKSPTVIQEPSDETKGKKNRQDRRSARACLLAHPEIASSERLRVRGPIAPITSATTAIAAAISAKTPFVPKRPRTKAMTKELNTVESRLHE